MLHFAVWQVQFTPLTLNNRMRLVLHCRMYSGVQKTPGSVSNPELFRIGSVHGIVTFLNFTRRNLHFYNRSRGITVHLPRLIILSGLVQLPSELFRYFDRSEFTEDSVRKFDCLDGKTVCSGFEMKSRQSLPPPQFRARSSVEKNRNQ